MSSEGDAAETFNNMGLQEDLLRGISEYGMCQPDGIG